MPGLRGPRSRTVRNTVSAVTSGSMPFGDLAMGIVTANRSTFILTTVAPTARAAAFSTCSTVESHRRTIKLPAAESWRPSRDRRSKQQEYGTGVASAPLSTRAAER